MNRATDLGFRQGIESLAETRIAAAMEAGEFDRLPGRGAPLRLEDDSLTPPEWRIAFRLLKNAGLAPAWIELRNEIDEAVALARSALAAVPASEPGRAEALRRFAEQADDINRRIALFNLSVPSPRWARSPLDVEREIGLSGSG